MSQAHPSRVPLYRVNACARALGEGNPCVVLLFERAQARFDNDEWLMQFAREMDVPATAYVRILDVAEARFEIRWFAPSDEEIELCGHGTVAAAHALTEHYGITPTRQRPLWLATRNYGTVEAWLNEVDNNNDDGSGARSVVEFAFPSLATEPVDEPPTLRAGLGGETPPQFVGRCDGKLLVEVATEAEVRGMVPAVPSLLEANRYPSIVTARAEEPSRGYDFVSRVFYLREDPVTGSAHAGLAPYWAEKLGKRTLVGYQASARGGFVHMHLEDARVILGGPAATVVRGNLG